MSFGLRNVNDPKKALRELLRVTKAGGRLVICEFSHPPSRSFTGRYRFYNDRILPVVAKTVEFERRRVRLPERVDPRLARSADARRHGSARPAGRTWPTATSRSASWRCIVPPSPSPARDPPGGGRVAAVQTPVGWDRDSSLSAGLATGGQAGPHRPHLRGHPVAQAAIARCIEAGSSVERGLADEVRMTDPIADAASRYLYEAGGKRIRPMLDADHRSARRRCDTRRDPRRDRARDDAPGLAVPRRRDGRLRTSAAECPAPTRCGATASRSSPATCSSPVPARSWPRLGERAIRLQADTFERLVLGQMHETVGRAGRTTTRRVLPPGALRQDRLPHRRRRAVGHHLLQRTGRVRGAAA